jgi:hypothetical protein
MFHPTDDMGTCQLSLRCTWHLNSFSSPSFLSLIVNLLKSDEAKEISPLQFTLTLSISLFTFSSSFGIQLLFFGYRSKAVNRVISKALIHLCPKEQYA